MILLSSIKNAINSPKISLNDEKFFTVEQVIEIHDAFLENHGGLPGIRDKGLLISAVEMPKASMFGEYLQYYFCKSRILIEGKKFL